MFLWYHDSDADDVFLWYHDSHSDADDMFLWYHDSDADADDMFLLYHDSDADDMFGVWESYFFIILFLGFRNHIFSLYYNSIPYKLIQTSLYAKTNASFVLTIISISFQ